MAAPNSPVQRRRFSPPQVAFKSPQNFDTPALSPRPRQGVSNSTPLLEGSPLLRPPAAWHRSQGLRVTRGGSPTTPLAAPSRGHRACVRGFSRCLVPNPHLHQYLHLHRHTCLPLPKITKATLSPSHPVLIGTSAAIPRTCRLGDFAPPPQGSFCNVWRQFSVVTSGEGSAVGIW